MKEKWQKQKEKILDQIDEKRFVFFIKMFFVIAFFCFSFQFLNTGLSKYESASETNAEAAVAFFLIEQGTYTKKIYLGEIIPSDTNYVYPFTVSNYDDTRRSEVALSYQVVFETTTNLPLQYSLYKNETYTDPGAVNLLEKEETIQNKDQMYFRRFAIEEQEEFTIGSNQSDIYNLVVKFPKDYKNSPEKYEGVVEEVKLTITAKQIIE